MYYLYKKDRSNVLPDFDYTFKDFEEFYDLARVITVPLIGTYYINIKTDSYDKLIEFLNTSSSYSSLVVYVQLEESLLKYVKSKIPNVSVLNSKSNWEVFEELIAKHGVLFKHKCARTLYYAVPHTYEDLSSALSMLKVTFPNVEISDKEIGVLYPIDTNIYPRQVLLSFLRLERGMFSRLEKCIETFGNDLVLYSMRKTNNQLLKDKISYLKSGEGTYLAKNLNWKNIVLMQNLLTYDRRGFKDVRTLMNMYLKGESINDIISDGTDSDDYEEYYSFRG